MAKAQSKPVTSTRRPNRAQRRRAAAATANPSFPEAAATPVISEISAIQTRPVPTEAEIRAVAYKLYLERRGTPGGHVDDWLEAERQLRAG